MVTNNIFERVFRIRYGDGEATAFTIEKGEQQYLISASHVFDTEPKEIYIYRQKTWEPLAVNVVWNDPHFADIIVFRLTNDISPRYLIELGTAGVAYSSWVYFLGFPLGLTANHRAKNSTYPLPFVKAAVVSNIDFTHHGLVRFFLDGHNNKGFSGGPVVQMKGETPIVLGTISQYENERILHKGEPTDYFANAGIIIASWDVNLLNRL